MSATSKKPGENSAVLLFTRLWDEASRYMTPALARHVLKVGFSDADKARMHELAVKNSEGRITPSELEELDIFVNVGDLLGILQSRARIFLKKNSKAKALHG